MDKSSNRPALQLVATSESRFNWIRLQTSRHGPFARHEVHLRLWSPKSSCSISLSWTSQIDDQRRHEYQAKCLPENRQCSNRTKNYTCQNEFRPAGSLPHPRHVSSKLLTVSHNCSYHQKFICWRPCKWYHWELHWPIRNLQILSKSIKLLEKHPFILSYNEKYR